MLYLVRVVLVALHPIAVFAANDWSRPCVTGTCSHDSGDGKSTAFSSLILNGPETSLSDITSAAGWQISGCDPAWSRGAHKVEITCSGNPAQARHCEHVLKGGAVDKIVRLPQNCGTGPFARVVAWTKPALNEKRADHSVHVVELDYDFKRPSSKSKAPITFVATASNVPTNSTARSAPRIQSRNRKRLPVVEPRFSKSGSSNAPPINLSKTFTLLDESLECPANGGIGIDAHLKADLDVGVDAQVAFGYTVSGSIFPPKIKHLALTSTLSGDAFAEFNVDASVTGTFDTGSVQLFSQDLPHLSISGIITLGPQFIINGQLSADLGVQASLKTGAKWTFPTVSLVFPPSQGQSVAQAVAAQTPLDVYINPTAEVNGQLTGHIVPKVLFGINVLDGLAEADVYLDADVSATLGLQVTTTGAAASGCVALKGGIDIAAGADGSIKGIFDKNLKFDIYNTEVSLFKNCFGNPASAAVKRSRSSLSKTAARISGVEAASPEGSTTTTDRLRPRLTMHTRDIICPGPEDGGQLVQVASQ